MSKAIIAALLGKALPELDLPGDLDFVVNIPPQPHLGDYATNVSLIAAKRLGRNPWQIAEQLAASLKNLDKNNIFTRIEAAKPGFVNFFLTDTYLQGIITEIEKQGDDWGKIKSTIGTKVLLEFVSANPTGPLHIGHGRWAVAGDIIARLLKATGHEVKTEFYINNVGNQVEKLAVSVRARRAGEPVPEDGYGGAYIADVKGETRDEMLENLLNQQKATLLALGIKFDNWFRENDLHDQGKVALIVTKLNDLGVTFNEEGAIWFKSQELGDDKNRVLMREDGRPTYFAADIAYHFDKFNRGYDYLINIWGTDHHGYVNRLKSALKVLGLPIERFEIIIGQLVSLYRGKELVRMSKRTGDMVTLQEVIDEIGADATRFFFAATDVNSHLDFDLELAKKQSNENPVYYVQYAHARICSIIKKSAERRAQNIDLSSLNHPEERALMFKLQTWPDIVFESARLRHTHRLTEYGKELAAVFHSFYEKCRVIGNPARLALVASSRITLHNILQMLGVSAPESM
ncbi:arginine--tRNA ligase [Candidatus Saganbacteria bacterium]|nr:arginine--tRNA ligase [Candidatus Saganbacteria bacterium]